MKNPFFTASAFGTAQEFADGIIAHQYRDIDYETLWRATTAAIPALIPT